MSKVALVTGGARGIGFGIAKAMAAEGWQIAIADVLQEADVQSNLDELRETGVEVLFCRCDITDAEQRAQALENILSQLGPVNVLVNNAGVAPSVRADILEAGEESYDRVMGINLRGPYFLTQLVARQMVEQKEKDAGFEACIINISSISATVASPSRGEYCLSKAGLSMMTQLWAVRLGEYGIPVYEIRPGVIKTDMTAAVTEKYDKLINEGLCVQSRWGYPEDIARAAAMLARGDLAYSTGQVVMVDGGLTLGRL